MWTDVLIKTTRLLEVVTNLLCDPLRGSVRARVAHEHVHCDTFAPA